MAELQVRRLGHALGAAITGLDLREVLDDPTVAELRRLWLDHLLLCFPDQDLTNDELVAFAGRFGELERWRRLGEGSLEADTYYSKTVDPGNPAVNHLTNQPLAGRPWDGYKEGAYWHSDRSFAVRPTLASFLLARAVPDAGGDTMFANQYSAYEALSPVMRDRFERLSAVHDYLKIAPVAEPAADALRLSRRIFPPVVHPVVRQHPETNRKALGAGAAISAIVGMTDEEGAPLVAFINQHSVKPEFTYRHRWRKCDLVMWDNRCLLHHALRDYDIERQPREMVRVSLRAPASGYVFGSAPAPARPEPAQPGRRARARS